MIGMVNCPHKINVPNDDGTQKLQDRRPSVLKFLGPIIIWNINFVRTINHSDHYWFNFILITNFNTNCYEMSHLPSTLGHDRKKRCRD